MHGNRWPIEHDGRMTNTKESGTKTAPARRALNVSDRVGLFGLGAFAFFGPVGVTGIHGALALMVLAALAQWGDFWRFWSREPLAWLSLTAVAYVGARLLWPLFSPDGAVDSRELRDIFSDYVALSGMLTMIVVWWLARPGSSSGWVLALAALGFVLNVIRYSSPEAVRDYMAGARAVFGQSLNGPGLFAATVLIGLVVLALPRLLNRPWTSASRTLLSYTVLAFVFCVALAALVWNQSRSAWVATVLGFAAVGAYRIYHGLKGRRSGRAGVVLALVLVGAAAAAWFSVGRDLVTQRTAGDQEAIAAVLAGDWDQIPDTSLGFRVQLWRAGFSLLSQRPLLGWGPGSSDELIDALNLKQRFPHFHDVPLQLLVELGVVGLALFGGILGAMAQRFVAGARRVKEPADYLLFTAVMAVIYLAVCLVQIRYDDPHGMFYLVMLGALMLRPWVRYRREDGL